MFLGRRIRTRLDLLKPDLNLKINNRQIGQSAAKGVSMMRHVSIGQGVMHVITLEIQNDYRAKLGLLSYQVEIGPNLHVV